MHNEDSWRSGYLRGYQDALRDVERLENKPQPAVEIARDFADLVLKRWRNALTYASIGEPPDIEDERFVCTDCGADGFGHHACPGRPGENQW